MCAFKVQAHIPIVIRNTKAENNQINVKKKTYIRVLELPLVSYKMQCKTDFTNSTLSSRPTHNQQPNIIITENIENKFILNQYIVADKEVCN